MGDFEPAELNIGAGGVTFSRGGGLLGRYIIEPDAEALESPRPFFHPLMSLAGRTITASRPPDHPWHRGLSIAIPHVGAADGAAPDGAQTNFWGGPTWVRGLGYRQLENNGTMCHEGFRGDGPGGVEERLTWLSASGSTLLGERRHLEARVHRSGPTHAMARAWWQLDVRSRWCNPTASAVTFGSPSTAGRPNAGYGGLFLRCSSALADSTILVESATERIRPADAMGTSSQWMALVSEQSGAFGSVVMVGWPDNPRTPTPWFVRTGEISMLCAAPFFRAEWTLTPGSVAAWGWSVLISDDAWDVEACAEAVRLSVGSRQR